MNENFIIPINFLVFFHGKKVAKEEQIKCTRACIFSREYECEKMNMKMVRIISSIKPFLKQFL